MGAEGPLAPKARGHLGLGDDSKAPELQCPGRNVPDDSHQPRLSELHTLSPIYICLNALQTNTRPLSARATFQAPQPHVTNPGRAHPGHGQTQTPSPVRQPVHRAVAFLPGCSSLPSRPDPPV